MAIAFSVDPEAGQRHFFRLHAQLGRTDRAGGALQDTRSPRRRQGGLHPALLAVQAPLFYVMLRAMRSVIALAALSAALATQDPSSPEQLMRQLNTELLNSRSATATLETWCRDHRLASEPKIVARL